MKEEQRRKMREALLQPNNPPPVTWPDFLDFAALIEPGEKKSMQRTLKNIFRATHLKVFSPPETMMVVLVTINDIPVTVGGEFSVYAYAEYQPLDLPTASATNIITLTVHNLHEKNPVGFMCRFKGISAEPLTKLA
jgi:hypothetical protein